MSPSSASSDSELPLLSSLPRLILALEFFLGGIPRISSFPFAAMHARIFRKSTLTAPTLYPVVPFRGDTDVSVYGHMRWVGVWMCATGAMLLRKETRGSKWTLGLVLFWTGAGVYSQRKTGMKYWLPVVNAMLGCLVYAIEMWKRGELKF